MRRIQSVKRQIIRLRTTTRRTTALLGAALPTAVAWCDACAAQKRMLTPEQAALVARVNTRTVYRWVESGLAHFVETAQGALWVCPDSLPALEPQAQRTLTSIVE